MRVPLRTKAVLRQYYQFFKVKIYSGTDNFQTSLRQLELHICVCRKDRCVVFTNSCCQKMCFDEEEERI